MVAIQGGAARIGLDDPAITGITIDTSDSTIRGLAIGGFHSYGIYQRIGDNTVIQGNYIGTATSGSEAVPNRGGIVISRGTGTLIAGNVISGNLTVGLNLEEGSGVVAGNMIGTDKSGTRALPNGRDGILAAHGEWTIGGRTPEERNIISGNTQYGIRSQGGLTDSSKLQILGNYIGTDATGTGAIPNRSGIVLGTPGNLVGGTEVGTGNLISGNLRFGVAIDYATGNRIQGNLLGTDLTGKLPLGNGMGGIIVVNSPGHNLIGGSEPGEGNTMAFNEYGAVIYSQWGRTFGATLRGNSIFGNSRLGIDLTEVYPGGPTPNDSGDVDDGPNQLQNAPVLETRQGRSPVLHGVLSSTPNTAFVLEIFSSSTCHPSGFGEGQTPLGTMSVTTDAAGLVRFTTNVRGAETGVLTATATDPQGNTSEFSNCT